MTNNAFTIAIIGRPNAGKSSLFNKVCKKQKAIVAKQAGVTRDYQTENIQWRKSSFQVVDTSGFEIKKNDVLHSAINKQYLSVLDETDAFLFLCDGQSAITQLDYELLSKVRKFNRPILCAVNKVDTTYFKNHQTDFTQFFGKDYLKLSAEKGEGIDRLLRTFEKELFLPKDVKKEPLIREAKVAIMGRPNVGKSSLLNILTTQSRAVVSPVSGTTRDAIDSKVAINGQHFLFIDTAGLRKRRKVTEKVELLSTQAAIQTLDRAEVLLLCIDAQEGPREQDVKIARLAWQRGVAIIILINKWDLLAEDKKTNTYWQKILWNKFRHFNRIPFLFVSATEKRNIPKIFSAISETRAFYEQVVDARELKENFETWTQQSPHKLLKKKKIFYKVRFYAFRQSKNEPPIFEVTTNHPSEIEQNYDRYLKNKLRETYAFWGIPIVIEYKLKPDRKRPKSSKNYG